MSNRGPPEASAGKKEAKTKRGGSIGGLMKFKNAMFAAAENNGALRLFHGMVARHPVLNRGLTAPDAIAVPEGVTYSSVRESLTDDEVKAKTEALTTLYYEWNHRAFVKLPMRETQQLLLRIGREKESHLLDFANQKRFEAFGNETALRAGEEPGALAAAIARAQEIEPIDYNEEIGLPVRRAAVEDEEEEMPDLPPDTSNFMGIGFGFGGPDPDDIDELFIEA
jgi:hypothetical protein